MSVLLRLMTAIQITRLTTALGAVGDIWFIILLTRADEQYVHLEIHRMDSLVAALGLGTVIAIGLFAYGASLNDILDVRHDSTFSPERPIPAGRIRFGQAVVLAVGSLIVAVLAAAFLGRWSICIVLLTAAGLLFYNTTAKYIPAAGLITIGLVHAAHMFIPNPELTFTLPVWLIMTHAMAVAGMVHVLEDKRPRLDRRSLLLAGTGWLLWSTIVIAASTLPEGRVWPERIPLLRMIGPMCAVGLFVFVIWWKLRRVDGRAGAEKVRRYGALWQSLYGVSWLIVLGLRREAIVLGCLAVAGFVVMTVLKEFVGLGGRPLEYRA